MFAAALIEITLIEMAPCRLFSPKRKGPDMPLCSLFTGTYGIRGLCWENRAERRGLSNPKRLIRKKWLQLQPLWSHLPVLLPAAMETFCETVQFYLRHLEDSLYPVMTEDQFAVKLFPMYRYFVTVWLRHQDLEVRLALLRGPCIPWVAFSRVAFPTRCCRASGFSLIPGAPETLELWGCWMERTPEACSKAWTMATTHRELSGGVLRLEGTCSFPDDIRMSCL